VVRTDAVRRGIQVVVRDHGRGFAVADAGPGFGIRESILGRLREVGGWAGVRAEPGAGTRVTLWVPA
jgi:signal transduction histidine kinase